MIATVPRDTHVTALNVSWTGCLPTEVIILMPKGTEVVAHPILHFSGGFWQTFGTYIRGRLPTTPDMVNFSYCCDAASAGNVKYCVSWPAQERLHHKRGLMPSYHWHHKYCVSVRVHRCGPSWIPVYHPIPTTGVDLSPISPLVPQNCPPLFILNAIRFHHSQLKNIWYPRHYHYDTVQCSRRTLRVNIQCHVHYWACFGTSGYDLYKSCDGKIVLYTGSVFNIGGNSHVGVGRRTKYI